jgi:hypothetical protein
VDLLGVGVNGAVFLLRDSPNASFLPTPPPPARAQTHTYILCQTLLVTLTSTKLPNFGKHWEVLERESKGC